MKKRNYILLRTIKPGSGFSDFNELVEVRETRLWGVVINYKEKLISHTANITKSK